MLSPERIQQEVNGLRQDLIAGLCLWGVSVFGLPAIGKRSLVGELCKLSSGYLSLQDVADSHRNRPADQTWLMAYTADALRMMQLANQLARPKQKVAVWTNNAWPLIMNRSLWDEFPDNPVDAYVLNRELRQDLCYKSGVELPESQLDLVRGQIATMAFATRGLGLYNQNPLTIFVDYQVTVSEQGANLGEITHRSSQERMGVVTRASYLALASIFPEVVKKIVVKGEMRPTAHELAIEVDKVIGQTRADNPASV